MKVKHLIEKEILPEMFISVLHTWGITVQVCQGTNHRLTEDMSNKMVVQQIHCISHHWHIKTCEKKAKWGYGGVESTTNETPQHSTMNLPLQIFNMWHSVSSACADVPSRNNSVVYLIFLTQSSSKIIITTQFLAVLFFLWLHTMDQVPHIRAHPHCSNNT